MSNTLFDMTPYKSEVTQNYSPGWIDATGTDPSWDEPDLEANSEISTEKPNGNAPSGWLFKSEFTITLESGQTVEVMFIPGLEGERKMHQFDLRGPINSTGFKSHLVLALEIEEFPHPRDYAQTYALDLVTQLESNQHSCKSTKQTHPCARAQALQEHTNDNDNSTLESAMAENETTDSSHTGVEVVEELSLSEAADRQRLELKVERSFYEAASGLRELRDRRLYRSTHKTWEEYCLNRFGFTRISANYKIAAAEVIENLLPTNLITTGYQILPTNERQVRPLTNLKPNEQRQVWQEAVVAAGGKVPSGRLVKDAVLRHMGIVEDLNQKQASLREFAPGDVVEIKALKRSPLHPFNGMWAIVEHVGTFSYMLRLGIVKDLQQCKAEEITLIDDEYTADIKAVAQRKRGVDSV